MEVGIDPGEVAVGMLEEIIAVARAAAHHSASKARTYAPIAEPQAPIEQSCIPF